MSVAGFRRAAFSIGLLVAVAANTERAHADRPEVRAGDAGRESAEARNFFQEGAAAFDERRYERAIELFRASYALSHLPELLYNIGVTAERLDRGSEAIEAYERYLREVPAAGNRGQVEERIRALRARQPSIVESPWFWVAVGGVVVMSVIIIVVVVSSSNANGSTLELTSTGAASPGVVGAPLLRF